MALVVFLRGVNVGGHRIFRPAQLSRDLSHFGVVNVGAAGTFVARTPGPRAAFRAELIGRLPFAADIVLCDGRDIVRLAQDHPFSTEPVAPDVVRFVSILTKTSRVRPPIPMALPSAGEWLVRIVEARGPFVFGMYRRHVKAIGYLGQLDKLFGVPVTTRNWNTIAAIVRILQRPPA
jgi:uncharacterized protein (DUF1697 family)